MAIGSIHKVIYLPSQIIYRYTAIEQVVVSAKELETMVMGVFQARPERAALQRKDRVLANPVVVMYKSGPSLYSLPRAQGMAIPPPQTAKAAPQGLAGLYRDRVTLSVHYQELR